MVSHIKNGHEYHLWTYRPIDVPEGVVVRDGNEILPESDIFVYSGPKENGGGSVSAFSNLFRYKLLSDANREGEWWCDTDVICLKPFNFMQAFVIATEAHGVPTTSVIKCWGRPMEYCYELACRKDRERIVWGEIGPALLKRAVEDHNLWWFQVPPSTFCPIHWENAEDFFSSMAIDEKTYAIHMWNEVWRRNDWDKDKFYRSNCLFEQLKERYLGTQRKPMII